MKSVKAILAVVVFSAAGCDTHFKLTPKNETVRRYVDQPICTKKDMLLYQWDKKSTNHFDQNEYVLYAPNKIDLERHFDGTLSTKYRGAVKNTTIVPKGTVLEVKEIFYYHTPLCCSGYFIMSTVNGNKIDGKMIQISAIFDRPPTGPENPPEKGLDVGRAHLMNEYAALCSTSKQ